MDVLESLKDRDAQEITELVALFQQRGIVSDEDGPWISSTMVEHWGESCDAFLRFHGYRGGKLLTYAKYFPHRGAIYSLYDSRRMTREEAAKYVERVAFRR